MDIENMPRSFSAAQVLVVGDVMLDTYVLGDAERVSPEAPVVVVRERERRHVLGGAGNVAANVAALGGSVHLSGVTGTEEDGRTFRAIAGAMGIRTALLVADSARPTTVKTRVVAHYHQIARVDREDTRAIDDGLCSRLSAALSGDFNPHVVIFSDYAKGFLDSRTVHLFREAFPDAIFVADIKPQNAELYRHQIDVLVPNAREAHGITGIECGTDEGATRAIEGLAAMFASSVVLKRGAQGMSVYDRASGEIVHLPTLAREVFDVTGAGDTVIAVLALSLAAGAPLLTAARIGNAAAGVVVERRGTSTLSIDELINRLA